MKLKIALLIGSIGSYISSSKVEVLKSPGYVVTLSEDSAENNIVEKNKKNIKNIFVKKFILIKKTYLFSNSWDMLY